MSESQDNPQRTEHILEKGLIGFVVGIHFLVKIRGYGVPYAMGYAIGAAVILIAVYFLTKNRPAYISMLALIATTALLSYWTFPGLFR